MARLSKEANEEREKYPPRQCLDCGQSADVHIGEHGFCCDHYAMRVVNMRRNADKRILDGNIYRDPDEQDREQRRIADAAYFKRTLKTPSPEIQKAKHTIKRASYFADKFSSGKQEKKENDDERI